MLADMSLRRLLPGSGPGLGLGHCAPVELHVVAGRALPREVAGHPALHQGRPRLPASGRPRAPGRAPTRARSRRRARSGSRCPCPSRASYGSTVSASPPGRAHDRDGAVAQRVHLGEAARLAARGHQEHVGARHDLVGEALVVGEAHGEAAGVALRPDAAARPAPPALRSRAPPGGGGRWRRSHHASATMSKPFCHTRREVTPTSGRSGDSGQPERPQAGRPCRPPCRRGPAASRLARCAGPPAGPTRRSRRRSGSRRRPRPRERTTPSKPSPCSGSLDLARVGRGHGVDELREHRPALQVADRRRGTRERRACRGSRAGRARPSVSRPNWPW